MVHISATPLPTTETPSVSEVMKTKKEEDINLDIPHSLIDNSLTNDKNTTMYGKVVKTLQKSLKKLIHCGSQTPISSLNVVVKNDNDVVGIEDEDNDATVVTDEKDEKLNMAHVSFKKEVITNITQTSTTNTCNNSTISLEDSTTFCYSSSEEEDIDEFNLLENPVSSFIDFDDVTSGTTTATTSAVEMTTNTTTISTTTMTTTSNPLPIIPTNPITTSDSPISSINTSYDHESSAKRFQKLPLLQGIFKDTFVKPLLEMPHPNDSEKICLLLDLDETLIHSSFTPVENPDLLVPLIFDNEPTRDIYVCKRPGVDQFLKGLEGHFEIVIFTASLSYYADPVIDFLDPTGIIKHRLYRESCVSATGLYSGLYLKDLSRLGRKLDRCLLVDNCPSSFALQPQNGLSCRSWFSDKEDRELCDRILPILLNLATSKSVREWREEHQDIIDTPY